MGVVTPLGRLINWSSLVRVMACRLFGYCWLTHVLATATGTQLSIIWIEICLFSFKENAFDLKMWSAKFQQFYSGSNESTVEFTHILLSDVTVSVPSIRLSQCKSATLRNKGKVITGIHQELWTTTQTMHSGDRHNVNIFFPSMVIRILKTRRSWNRLIMAIFSILTRKHVYIEMVPHDSSFLTTAFN